MDVSLGVLKESNKSRFDSYSVRNSVLITSHITFRDSRMHIFSHNLSRNSCIHFSYLSLAAGLLPFPAAFVLIKGTLSFIRLCFVSFLAALVTARVERVSSGLWSLCTQVDNVSNLTCEDWREESCESLVMASRLSRQYLRQKKYLN